MTSSKERHHALNRPICLVLDFDGTLTKKDTMHLVAEVGYSRQKQRRDISQPRPWNEIVDAYMNDFRRHADGYIPKPDDRSSTNDELVWLDSLKEVESASAARALEAGIFDQVRLSDMEGALQSFLHKDILQLRQGWLDLISDVRSHNSSFDGTQGIEYSAILSVNWSREFIRQTMLQTAAIRIKNTDSIWKCPPAFANEIPSIAECDPYSDQAQSKQYQGIRTSGDKAKIFGAFTAEKEDALSIYIGDSSTDLGCLVKADIGICLRNMPLGSGQKELAAILDRTGVEIKSIADTNVSKLLENRSKPCLFWATNFLEIRDWLFGPPP